MGHIANACKAKTTAGRSSYQFKRCDANAVTREEGSESETDDDTGLFNIDMVASNLAPIMVSVSINGVPVNMMVDTGAAVTLISERAAKSIPRIKLKKTDNRLTTYTGEKIKVCGECSVVVEYNNQEYQLSLFVVKGGTSCLLGRDWLSVIKLDWHSIATVQKSLEGELNQLLDRYQAVFDGKVGTIRGCEARLLLREGAQPRFHRARSVPFAMREAVGSELDRLESEGIIERVSTSQWATPLVVVPKRDGSLRLCGDYRLTVNTAIEVDAHPLPKPEEIFATLSGGEKFTKIDLSSAYQQLLLEQQSRELVTINTHKGLYRYTRLPFGVSAAPAIFQRTMDSILSGLPHVACYIDDILITGRNDSEHLKNLEKVLARLEEYGVKAKRDKCSFLSKCVQYLGHNIDSMGLHVLPDKVQAIVKAPLPKNKNELRSFLGFINYYRKFIPQLSAILAPLNVLLCKQVQWKWTKACSKAVQVAKQKLSEAPVLMHFNPKLPIILATDASSYGVGAVLSHIGPDGAEHPVAFASRSLSASERNYAQLEKEALSIIFGIKQFHQYLYGQKFKLITDHKPLTTIFGPKSGVPQLAAARLQRWALLLSCHSYTIEYRNTRSHANADGLSRLPLDMEKKHVSPDVCSRFNIMQMSSLPLSHVQLKAAIRSDRAISRAVQLTREGWDHVTENELLEDLKPIGKEGMSSQWRQIVYYWALVL